MSKDKHIDSTKGSRHVFFALDEYVTAWPLALERHGYHTPYLQKLGSKLCAARDVLANIYVKTNKINLAQMQYHDIIKNLIPFVEWEVQNDHSKKRVFEYLLLKHTINLGLLYLKQERFDMVCALYIISPISSLFSLCMCILGN